ncbi:TrkH family potassium uptake protein [Pseudoneobacillus rhizosphaerae]|jgi:potassium uptake TrkH family protein|uniref:Ktr system potassium uptake protein B n=1 Tax=Pseudoneobacillus rhizosphaerae TaxID=2880968 RepID=A0A9C7G9Q9_9BACI|nr:TrkH family potassium uptake protein [Pseudoneobacillus rhizosphaerae]CAG9608569.1 Ktr system potassium uptake protein B [Pseudoneobacillus rhizosphaerae]
MKYSLRKYISILTPAQIIVVYYFIAVSVSMVLLSLPIALKPNVKWTFMDALFTAVSAVSVTGLTTVNISETFSETGIYILMFVLQFGGIGVMTLGTFFWLLLGKKIGLRERRLIMTDQNQSSLAGLVKLLKQILVIIILIEILGAIILGTYFMNFYSSGKDAFLHGLFASVSATTNAGFDITGQSLIPYANDYFVQLVSIILIIFGSIGFPVLVETKEYLFDRRNEGRRHHFSLNTKLTTVTFLGLLILGTIGIYLLEFDHFLKDKKWYESFFYAFFHSTTTKSAGLTTMDINQFSGPTQLFISALMFIGASPSSTGGGIRVTTLALNLLFFYHFARGNRTIKVFKRELHEDDVIKSLVVSMMALFICFTSLFILCITEDIPLLPLIFEVSSAFGTTGLSLGITSELSSVGKMIIILLMFIGRVGMLSFLFIIGSKRNVPNYHYPKERVIIG